MKASRANVRHAQSLAELATRMAEVEKKLDLILAILAAKPGKKAPAEKKEGGSDAH